MVNDFGFPKSTILNVLEKEKFAIIICNTIIPDEYGNNFTTKLYVYVEKKLYFEKKEKYKDMLLIGKNIYVAGKTVHEIENGELIFKVHVQSLKGIDYSRKKENAQAKMLEITLPKIVKKSLANRCEFLGTYYNDEEKTLGRKIVISIPKEKEKILKDDTEYNISGKLVLRKGNNQILPVVISETFVKDVPLNTNVYIEGANNKWR